MINFYQLVITTYGGIYNGSIQTGVYRVYACLISGLPIMPKNPVFFKGLRTFAKKTDVP